MLVARERADPVHRRAGRVALVEVGARAGRPEEGQVARAHRQRVRLLRDRAPRVNALTRHLRLSYIHS